MPGRLRDPQRGRDLPTAPPGTIARTDGPAPAGSASPSGASAPLEGTTVLVPRSPERAGPLAALLRAQGATVLVSPAIERAPIGDTTAVDAAVAELAAGRFDWVVVTSVNAIDELAASAARHGLTLADLSDRARSAASPGDGARWAAVGPATRRALEAAGVRVDLEAGVNSARGLLAAFDSLPGAVPGRVLVPQGDLARPTMSQGLRDRGWDAVVVTAYRTVAHALSPEVVAAWRAGDVDVVVLTSGSVAREVAAQLGADPRVAGVAIGEPTAEAALAVGLRVDAVAAQATDEALATAVLAVGARPSEPRRGTARATSDNQAPVSEPRRGIARATSDDHASDTQSSDHQDPDTPPPTEGRNHP